jgi:hypothetical protein
MTKETMKITPLKYSPQDAATYSFGRTGLLASDAEAWNLAWLSHPIEREAPKDPRFTTLVRRTLQTVVATGTIDIVGAYPDNAKVRGYLRLPPAQAVRRIMAMAHLADTPLFAAYGTQWTDTMQARAKLYREPYDPTLDQLVVDDCSQALAVIARL